MKLRGRGIARTVSARDEKATSTPNIADRRRKAASSGTQSSCCIRPSETHTWRPLSRASVDIGFTLPGRGARRSAQASQCSAVKCEGSNKFGISPSAIRTASLTIGLRATTAAGSSTAKEGLPATWTRHFIVGRFERAGFPRFLAAGIFGILLKLRSHISGV